MNKTHPNNKCVTFSFQISVTYFEQHNKHAIYSKDRHSKLFLRGGGKGNLDEMSLAYK